MSDLVNRIAELEALLEEERQKRIAFEEVLKKEKFYFVWSIGSSWFSIVSDTVENARKLAKENLSLANMTSLKMFDDAGNAYHSFNNYVAIFEGHMADSPSVEDILVNIEEVPLIIPWREMLITTFYTGW